MRALLVEDVIAKDKIEIDIDYGVSTTQHSSQRQTRHGEDKLISNEEISNNVKAAFHILTKAMIRDTYDIGERVLIKNLDSNLNIVGVAKDGGSNGIIFKVITVMRHPNFRNIKDTKIIRITNDDLKNNS